MVETTLQCRSLQARELCVVIVNWNTRELIDVCLSRLSPLEQIAHVVVVDNGSTDGSADLVACNYPWVHLLRNSENEGYARGNNRGWRSKHSEYVLFLNSDTIPDIEAIESMVQFLAANVAVGIAGPALRGTDGGLQVGAAGWDLTLASAASYQLLLHRLVPHWSKPFYLWQDAFRDRMPIAVDWVSGAAMLIRRTTLETVGGVPEMFFMYAEDVELCRLARQAGFKVVYMPNASITHLHGASAATGTINVKWLKSTLDYYKRSHGKLKTALIATIFALGALTRFTMILPLAAVGSTSAKRRAAKYAVYMRVCLTRVLAELLG